ncbi:hypothetical protein [Flavobacterium sp.]|uniref:hypothetical protein n=1 Tax=Flavobacterium sp. TaxID=239 RepID=UPI003340D623
MDTKKLEPFLTRILFKYQDTETQAMREIAYIYNREALDHLLNIKKQTYDNSQFIEIGDIITLEEYKCKVMNINFKLEEKTYDKSGGYGINMHSPTDPNDFNCQIGVFVERID